MSDERFILVITPSARRQLIEQLPATVAFAAHEFIIEPLLENPTASGSGFGHPWKIAIAGAEAPIG